MCAPRGKTPRARRYASRIKLIGHREEVVSGMKAEIMELLKLFREHNKGVKPEAIVVYRDGVSHGEFKEARASLTPSSFAY